MRDADLTQTRALEGIKACVFDAYGTLLDVHSAMARHRRRLGEAWEDLSALWRRKQLEYTWLRSLMGRYADFRQVTEEALDFALDKGQIGDPSLRRALIEDYHRLTPYPEVRDCLEALRAHGVATAILSNGSPAMLAAAVASAGIADALDAVISVDPLRVYKPDPRVYGLAAQTLGLQPAEICFQSSNAWDAAGAASFGFRVVWINRSAQPPERLPFGPDAELRSLDGLLSLLGH